jgi:hypothetical protein
VRVLHRRLGCQWTHNPRRVSLLKPKVRQRSEIKTNNTHVWSRDLYTHVSSTTLQTCTTPRLPQSSEDVRKSTPAPTSQGPPTSRNFFFHLTPATILQQTSATRPPPIPCKRRASSSAEKKIAYVLPPSFVYIACLAWNSRGLHRGCWGMGRIPSLRRQPRTPFQLRYAPCT